MLENLDHFWQIVFNVISLISMLIVFVFGIVKFIGVKIYSLYRDFRVNELLKRNIGKGVYDEETIKNSTKYYIKQKCSNIDPAQEVELRDALIATREDLFEKVDYFLNNNVTHRHLLILADSGTGKTSFVLNYYAYNYMRKGRRKCNNIYIVPLGMSNADEVIDKCEDKSSTSIFLDAFDEDVKAIDDHRGRMEQILRLCSEFKRVIITCRTQFFPMDEEIPIDTGILRLEPRKVGLKSTYEFRKLYLSPFNDDDIRLYLRKRFPFFRFSARKKAFKYVQKIPLLSVRPMILAHIPDIVLSNMDIKTSSDLYEVMVDAWINRETAWEGDDKDSMREFSEKLAVELYNNREKRGMEKISADNLKELAVAWNMEIPKWRLTGRSLLNRDASGYYKFAHRSIMEYLYVYRLLERDVLCYGNILTDQMLSFFSEKMGYLYYEIFPVEKKVMEKIRIYGSDCKSQGMPENIIRACKERFYGDPHVYSIKELAEYNDVLIKRKAILMDISVYSAKGVKSDYIGECVNTKNFSFIEVKKIDKNAPVLFVVSSIISKWYDDDGYAIVFDTRIINNDFYRFEKDDQVIGDVGKYLEEKRTFHSSGVSELLTERIKRNLDIIQSSTNNNPTTHGGT